MKLNGTEIVTIKNFDVPTYTIRLNWFRRERETRRQVLIVSKKSRLMSKSRVTINDKKRMRQMKPVPIVSKEGEELWIIQT